MKDERKTKKELIEELKSMRKRFPEPDGLSVGNAKAKKTISVPKEIAELLILSPRTIDLHRLNIRKKLGLKSKSVNLRSTLLSYS